MDRTASHQAGGAQDRVSPDPVREGRKEVKRACDDAPGSPELTWKGTGGKRSRLHAMMLLGRGIDRETLAAYVWSGMSALTLTISSPCEIQKSQRKDHGEFSWVPVTRPYSKIERRLGEPIREHQRNRNQFSSVVMACRPTQALSRPTSSPSRPARQRKCKCPTNVYTKPDAYSKIRLTTQRSHPGKTHGRMSASGRAFWLTIAASQKTGEVRRPGFRER